MSTNTTHIRGQRINAPDEQQQSQLSLQPLSSLLTILTIQAQYQLMDEAPTQPTLKTILEAVNAIGVELHQFRTEVNKHLEQLEIRMDRIDGEVKHVHSELLTLRADFRELKAEFNEFRSQFKQPA